MRVLGYLCLLHCLYFFYPRESFTYQHQHGEYGTSPSGAKESGYTDQLRQEDRGPLPLD